VEKTQPIHNLTKELLLNNSSSISGFVTDAENGEQLAYANVYLENTALGSATNEKGYYIIHKVPEGSYQIVFSYISYETIIQEIEVRAGQRKNRHFCGKNKI
jgi:hypothetical protein